MNATRSTVDARSVGATIAAWTSATATNRPVSLCAFSHPSCEVRASARIGPGQRPQNEGQEARQREVAERVAERGLVRVGRRGDERDVRHEQEEADRGGTAVPHRDAIESA